MCACLCVCTCMPQMGSSHRYTPGDCPSCKLPVATSDSKSLRFSSFPQTYTHRHTSWVVLVISLFLLVVTCDGKLKLYSYRQLMSHTILLSLRLLPILLRKAVVSILFSQMSLSVMASSQVCRERFKLRSHLWHWPRLQRREQRSVLLFSLSSHWWA